MSAYTFRLRGLWLLCAVLVPLLAAGGCSLGGSKSTQPVQKGPVKRGAPGTKPYTIRGRTYQPLLSAHGFREEGVASWYGPDFHGKKTANGERYDMHGMTAAHKLLPFNTQLKVTNTRNGKSIMVRVNDRGPFVADRIIDLTRTGAKELDMLGSGTAPVIIESVGTVAGLKDGDLTGRFYVQVGAFGQESNARNLVRKIGTEGLDARTYFAENVNFWRVQIGPYPSLSKAESAAGTLAGRYPGNFVVAE